MKKLYAIYDAVSHSALMPLLSEVNEAAAVRAFGDAVKSPNTLFYAHPGDFSLYYLGDIDDETCVLYPVEPATLVVRASSILEVS